MTKCPYCHCDLVRKGDGEYHRWDCGTYKRDGDLFQSDTCRISELKADNARLRTALDQYPKTADGVPVVPGMRLFRPEVPYSLQALSISKTIAFGPPPSKDHWYCGYCYSKASLALAAREAAKEAP